MSRIIKFRAYRKDKNVYCTSKHAHVTFDGRVFLALKDPFNDTPKQDEVVLEQFTGLLDKNGKEIYEGDIVTHYALGQLGETMEKWTHPVYFKDGCFFVGYDMINIHDLLCNCFHANADCWPVEIVGNIHQNPELLK